MSPNMMENGMTEEEFCKSLTVVGFKTGKVLGENKMKMEEENAQLDHYKIVNDVGMYVTEYDDDTGMTKFMYNKPIPEEIAIKTINLDFEKPIYQS